MKANSEALWFLEISCQNYQKCIYSVTLTVETELYTRTTDKGVIPPALIQSTTVRPSNNPHLKGIPNIRFSDSTLERRSLLPSLHLSYSAVVIKLIVEMTVIWLKYDDGELTKLTSKFGLTQIFMMSRRLLN